GVCFKRGGGNRMETTSGGSQRDLDHSGPRDSAHQAIGGTTATGATKRIELEVPLGSAVEGVPAELHVRTPKSPLLDSLKRLWPWSKPASAPVENGAYPGGIHEVTRATNSWFDGEVAILERDARSLAADWAGKGLPRHDVARTAPLEVEQFLAGRCAETFRQWTDRVRVTMRDRIAREAQAIGDRLVELRGATTRIER